MKIADYKATLSFSNGQPGIDMPVYQGSIGPDVVDIRKLYGQTGMFTYDPGFLSTASCQSAITYIDGDKGELLYRGHPIEQLATQCDFLETCHLLLYGELPNAKKKADFTHLVTNHTMVHEQMQFFLRGFRRDAHPMAVLTGLIGGLSAFYHDSTDINNAEHREIAAIRLIAKMPTLVAMAYKYSIGQPFMYPKNDLSYSGNFLRMMFGNPCEDYKVNPVLERALDRIFILHADHEQNASTSTVRLCGSSGTNPFAAIAAGVACLWGPAHGGANEACLNMLEDIQRMGGVSKVGEFMNQVKDKNSNVKLMGFGHRVYKNYDPRAKLMQETCNEVLQELGLENDPLFKLAKALEKIALEDDYFVSRKLYPNVDFYSGIVQRAIGNYLLPQVLAPFLSRQRDARMSVYSETQEAAVSLFRAGSVDVAIVFETPQTSDLGGIIIGAEPLLIAAAPSHPLAARECVTLQELENFDFIGGLRGSQFFELVESTLRGAGLSKYRVALHMQDSVAIKNAAAHGLGLACSPACVLEDEVKAGKLMAIRTEPKLPPLVIKLIMNPNAASQELLGDFIPCLVEAFKSRT